MTYYMAVKWRYPHELRRNDFYIELGELDGIRNLLYKSGMTWQHGYPEEQRGRLIKPAAFNHNDNQVITAEEARGAVEAYRTWETERTNAHTARIVAANTGWTMQRWHAFVDHLDGAACRTGLLVRYGVKQVPALEADAVNDDEVQVRTTPETGSPVLPAHHLVLFPNGWGASVLHDQPERRDRAPFEVRAVKHVPGMRGTNQLTAWPNGAQTLHDRPTASVRVAQPELAAILARLADRPANPLASAGRVRLG